MAEESDSGWRAAQGSGRSSVEASPGAGGRAESFAVGRDGAAILVLALRFALNAPPFGLRRAALRAETRSNNHENQTQKGDTSNELTKGTFLTRFDISGAVRWTKLKTQTP